MGEVVKKLPVGGNDDLKWLELVIQQVSSLRFGVVEIVVHDGRVIQIEKTERLRLDKAAGDHRTERTR
ncbi:MAG: YezD family protein [Verrucomicrobiota bacterium]